MMLFNPVRMHEVAPRTVVRVLETEFEAKRPMGNVAASHLAEAIELWLVGMSQEIAPVLPRLLEWLDMAIAGRERCGESLNFHSMNLHQAKALGLWMRDGVNAVAEWEQARQLNAAALLDTWLVPDLMPGSFKPGGSVWAKNRVPTSRLDGYMAFCFQAEQYEEGIAEYEKYHGDKISSIKKVRFPRDLGYVLCLHEARGQYEPDELFEAGRKVLRTKLQSGWLGNGQYLDATMWLKIVYWHHDPTLTPLQTVLHAYDNMPKVPRPDFVVPSNRPK